MCVCARVCFNFCSIIDWNEVLIGVIVNYAVILAGMCSVGTGERRRAHVWMIRVTCDAPRLLLTSGPQRCAERRKKAAKAHYDLRRMAFFRSAQCVGARCPTTVGGTHAYPKTWISVSDGGRSYLGVRWGVHFLFTCRGSDCS